MKIEQRRKLECLDANCGFTKDRCLRYYGKSCIKLGGTKIPLQSASINQSSPLRAQSNTKLKPYFLQDGWQMTEGREY